ncbi:hypothetical protein [Dactylosporangium sp. CA-139066]|uniref:hypothetical protein n=1 Tax=Dactylosporangium sp. CA-139066 TaxID=3239930 RepID=UPI003D909D99
MIPIEDATAMLTAPDAGDATPGGGYFDATEFTSLFSPTWWGNEIIKEVTGFDLFGEVGQALMGNWELFAKAGDALKHLADWAEVTGTNVNWVAAELGNRWDGHAADAAVNYFAGTAAPVLALPEPLRKAGEGYISTSKGIWQLSNQATNFAEALADSCIVAVAATAAGTVAVETGVGAVIGYGLAALEFARAVELVSKLTQIAVAANALAFSSMGLIKALETHLIHTGDFPLPDVPYAFPGQGR